MMLVTSQPSSGKSAVGLVVGLALGDNVGFLVGDPDGERVGLMVGGDVGFFVGDPDGDSVGLVVGAAGINIPGISISAT